MSKFNTLFKSICESEDYEYQVDDDRSLADAQDAEQAERYEYNKSMLDTMITDKDRIAKTLKEFGKVTRGDLHPISLKLLDSAIEDFNMSEDLSDDEAQELREALADSAYAVITTAVETPSKYEYLTGAPKTAANTEFKCTNDDLGELKGAPKTSTGFPVRNESIKESEENDFGIEMRVEGLWKTWTTPHVPQEGSEPVVYDKYEDAAAEINRLINDFNIDSDSLRISEN